jgi:hypothetical protein
MPRRTAADHTMADSGGLSPREALEGVPPHEEPRLWRALLISAGHRRSVGDADNTRACFDLWGRRSTDLSMSNIERLGRQSRASRCNTMTCAS